MNSYVSYILNAVLSDTIFIKRRFKKKSKNVIAARNQREYFLDGKLVAVNRHKATDEKEDSLEEFMTAYSETHSEKECNQMMHKLVIKPAKRTYTYRKRGLVAPLHPGDLVLYEKTNKIKGNTKTLVFPAVSVEYNQVLCSKKGVKWAKREWEARVDGNKIRKAKFCKRLQSGCLQVIDVRLTGEYLRKIACTRLITR